MRSIELVGSRATGQARPGSDWDFRVRARDFGSLAVALPELLAPLAPLAQQWDRLSDEQCWMLILHGPVKVDLIFPEDLHGPVKVDLIFPEEPHVHEPPWVPSAENLGAIDAHLWDWLLWLRPKEASGKRDLVAAELEKLFVHLLRPLGVHRVPTSVADAVALYQPARDALGTVSRELEAEVARALLAAS